MFSLLFNLVGGIKGILIGAAVIAVVGTVTLHFRNDSNRAEELVAAKARMLALDTANAGFEMQVGSLTERIRANNEKKLADMAAAQAQLDEANLAILTVTTQNEVISEQLAVANFSILEAMRDDEDYADWAFEPTHITVWSQLRDSAEGSIPAQ